MEQSEFQQKTLSVSKSSLVEEHDLEMPILILLMRALDRNKFLIIAMLAASLVVGLIVTLIMTPEYTATSRIEISRQSDNITKVEGVSGREQGKDLEFYQTQYSLLEANSLATRVVKSLNLDRDDSFFETFDIDPENTGLFEEEQNGTIARGQRTERKKMAERIVLANVTIQPIRGSSLVDVGFTSSDPQLSAKIANAWVDQFIESNLDRRYASTKEAREFLEERLGQLRNRLEASERDLVRYAADKRIIALSTSEGTDGKTRSDQTLVDQDLQALNSALAQATAARIVAKSAVQNIATASSENQNNVAVNGLRQQRAIVASEYAKLMTQFEPEYPTAKALESQISALDESIAKEEQRMRTSVNADYRKALNRETQLKKQVEQLKQSVILQRGDSIQYNIYQREVDTNRQLYDGLLQRYKEIGVAGVGSNNLSVVDRAEVPTSPSSPNLPLNLALALLAGIGLSGTLIFSLQQIDQSLNDPFDVSKIFGLVLLGNIPKFKDFTLSEELQDRKSVLSDAYFSVKTNLSFLTEHGLPRSLMLTSSGPDEGKSMSSLALADMFARTGKSVVLIDADMRNPSLPSLMEQSADKGLTNYLSGEVDWKSIVKPSDRDNLSVIYSGPKPPNPAELLSGDRASQLIQSLLTKFDHVILDCPPVLGLADAPLLSTAVEGVVFIVQAHGAKMRNIQSAIQRLSAVDAKILGAVVTKLDDSSFGYDYDYKYGSEN